MDQRRESTTWAIEGFLNVDEFYGSLGSFSFSDSPWKEKFNVYYFHGCLRCLYKFLRQETLTKVDYFVLNESGYGGLVLADDFSTVNEKTIHFRRIRRMG